MKTATFKPFYMCFIALAALAVVVSPAFAETVPNPTVTGPIPVNDEPGAPSHDYVFFTPPQDLAEFGYVEEEFFIEGVANKYRTPNRQNASVISGGHSYKTRIVVRRPVDAEKFNGVVILEWQNVTAGYELDAHWAPSWEHFIRRGYAWVGVSAQKVGLHGNPPALGENNGLIAWSPTRYGSLDLTDGGTILDDSLCYDVYSQAAQAVKHPSGVDPMGGLQVKTVIAAGASQSAALLSIYHNSIHPLHEVMDGFYMLVGGSNLRTDLDVKVFQYLSETDLGMGPMMRMADSDHFRSWEVAGAAHSSYVSHLYDAPITVRDFGAEVWGSDCDQPPFSRVRGYMVINQQYDLLVKWIETGVAPPRAPKIQFQGLTRMKRDEYGIALGGIRLPEVEVPTALNTGTNSGDTFCMLFGTHIPFEDDVMGDLYSDHNTYVRQVTRSVFKNVFRGYITREGASEILQEAAQSDIGQ